MCTPKRQGEAAGTASPPSAFSCSDDVTGLQRFFMAGRYPTHDDFTALIEALRTAVHGSTRTSRSYIRATATIVDLVH
jgi:hypothetical protein